MFPTTALSGLPNSFFTRVQRGPDILRIGLVGAAAFTPANFIVARHRIDFTQAELNRMAEAAAKYGVPITVERVAPDGTKVTATAAKASNGDRTNDLDRELQEFEAGHGEARR